MATASATVNLPVSADKVWQRVGGFLTLPDWLPFIVSSESDEGGRIRKLTAEDGALITERLESFDNQARTYSYSIIEGPFPVTDYLATLQVTASGDNQTQVSWSGRFNPKGTTDAEVSALFQGVYEGGMEGLKSQFQAD